MQGKIRPAKAVEKFADAEGVELVVSDGKLVIDMVINSLMDTSNRQILMNPFYRYSAVQTCQNKSTKSMAIQYFA